MSVTLINIFEVPAGDEDETALHQSLRDAQFRFVNIAHWTSEDDFNAAVGSPGFREESQQNTYPADVPV